MNVIDYVINSNNDEMGQLIDDITFTLLPITTPDATPTSLLTTSLSITITTDIIETAINNFTSAITTHIDDDAINHNDFPSPSTVTATTTPDGVLTRDNNFYQFPSNASSCSDSSVEDDSVHYDDTYSVVNNKNIPSLPQDDKYRFF